MNDDDLEFNSDRFEQVRNARNSETAEDYTEMIADLIRNAGEARAVDLAKHFGVTGPTVNSIIRRLVRDGLVVSKPYRSIFLTDKGQTLADYCKKRHEIVYNFLIKIGVNSAETLSVFEKYNK
jgi:DtxR family manganese transport transcriptional regulator